VTLAADLAASAARHPDRDAVVAGGTRLTYAEFAAAVERCAGGLAAAGVQRGDRVAVVMPNSAEAAVAIYGAVRAGAAFVPLPPGAKPDRLQRLIEHCGAKAVLRDLDGLGTGSAPEPPGDEDLASIIYTSGSTGEPKGAAFAHRNMTFVAGSIISYLGLTADDRILCPLPLSHTYGLYHLIMAVRQGATLVLEAGLAFPGRVVAALERERITLLPGVPTTWELLTTLTGLAERELPHLRTLTNAGAALSVDQVAAVRATFPGARLFSMYGQTECKRVCYLPPEELDVRPGSVGIAIPGTEVWLADDGELMIRGDHVMLGYWHDPEATAAKVTVEPDGSRVLRSGDLFRQDADGFLYFVARKDDIIKSRGEKVAPLEVEHVLLRAPGVSEAAVVGVPDRLLGEAVIAHVAGTGLDPVALRRHCLAHLEAHMVPSEFHEHDGLPRTHSGKIDRAALKTAGPADVPVRPVS
jgi:long-chain acyl-CoA synthetase